jgi:hypothetical protein
MRLRLVLSSIVLATLAANPCFAKDGHAQHGARAGTANNGASGKGASGAHPAPSKANVPLDAEAIVAPPVLPPHGVTQQQIRTINPSGKTPANPVSRATLGATTIPAVRNAIGQPVVSPKNFGSAQPHPAPAVQGPGAAPPQIFRGVPAAAAPAVSSNLGHSQPVNVTALANRSSINGASVIRPSAAPVGIGGPARPANGINGTAVQSKH